MYKINEYINFLKSKNMVGSAISIVIGTLVSNIIQKVINEVIDPIANGNKPTLHIREFGLEILNFVFVTYVLFLVFDYIENIL